MKRNFKVFPVGNLPYEDNKSATRMMVKLYEDIPYLPLLSRVSPNESLIYRTLNGIPCIEIDDTQINFNQTDDSLDQALLLDTAYKNPTLENLDLFRIESFYLERYLQVIKRIQPKKTVINFVGVLTILQKFINKENDAIIEAGSFHKIIIQALAVKALWIINEIHQLSPDTTPIILIEDPMLNKFGLIKKLYDKFTRDVIVDIYSRIIQKIHDYDGLVCVQCFGKCDWSILIESGVDMISFGAYTNPNNLRIMPKIIENFLARGGIINWGIVPVKSENVIRNMNSELLYQKLECAMEDLINSGVNSQLVYNRSTVSVQGNLDKLDVFFAEKAIILTKQIADKLMTHSDSLQ